MPRIRFPAIPAARGGLVAAAVALSVLVQPTRAQELDAALAATSLEEDDPSVDQRLEAMRRRAWALLAVHVPTAVGACREMAAEAERHSREDYAAIALALESLAEVKRSGRAEAEATLEQAQARMPAHAARAQRAHFAFLKSALYYQCAKLGASMTALQVALQLGHEQGDAWLEARCRMMLHDLFHRTGSGHDEDELQLAEELLQEIGDESGLVRLSSRRVCFLLEQGRKNEADRLAENTLAEAERVGDRLVAFHTLAELASHARSRAEFEAALAYVHRMKALARAMEDRMLTVVALDLLAWCHLMAGQAEHAPPYLEEALELVRPLGLFELEMIVLESAAELALARRDKEALLEYSGRRRELLRGQIDGPESADYASAIHDLAKLRAERRAGVEIARERAALRSLYRTTGTALLTVLAVALALVFLRGKRRVERANRQLRAETERVQRSEAARAQLEHQIRHLERLEGIGLLAAGVTHDFNNILCAILGNAELLRDGSDEETVERVEAITDAAMRGTALCSKVLDYARPSLANREVLDLREIVTEMRSLLQAGLRGNAQFEIECGERAVCAEVDQAGLEQVLLNLVTNASEASGDSCAIALRVRRATGADVQQEDGTWFGQLQKADEYAVIEVEDGGKGVSAEQLRRLFDPFFTTRFEGRGLGLSVAFGIVTGHGGAFCVHSSPGQGARFTIYLPGAKAPRELIPPAPELTHDSAPFAAPGCSVLVIDDEQAVLGWVRRALESLGWIVHTALDGERGIELFETTAIDVVLLDVTMPDMDGIEVLERLRGPRPDLAIVVMSGHGQVDVLRRVDGERVEQVLRKPFTITALEQALSRSLSDSRAGRERGKPTAT